MALIKTMNKINGRKLNEWLETISDKALRDIIKENIVITGGCFPSMIQNETTEGLTIAISQQRKCNEKKLRGITLTVE